MYEAAASYKDIARAPVTKWEPPGVTLAKLLLRCEAQDECSCRNSVSCQSLASLRRYGTRERNKSVPP